VKREAYLGGAGKRWDKGSVKREAGSAKGGAGSGERANAGTSGA
jgi:hypothetical protein